MKLQRTCSTSVAGRLVQAEISRACSGILYYHAGGARESMRVDVRPVQNYNNPVCMVIVRTRTGRVVTSLISGPIRWRSWLSRRWWLTHLQEAVLNSVRQSSADKLLGDPFCSLISVFPAFDSCSWGDI